MKMLILASGLSLALLLPAGARAADQAQAAAAAASGKRVSTSALRAFNNQTAVACNFCFTCGGDWTVFAGSIRSVGDRPLERGSSCSGALVARTDSSPFLCCR